MHNMAAEQDDAIQNVYLIFRVFYLDTQDIGLHIYTNPEELDFVEESYTVTPRLGSTWYAFEYNVVNRSGVRDYFKMLVVGIELQEKFFLRDRDAEGEARLWILNVWREKLAGLVGIGWKFWRLSFALCRWAFEKVGLLLDLGARPNRVNSQRKE